MNTLQKRSFKLPTLPLPAKLTPFATQVLWSTYLLLGLIAVFSLQPAKSQPANISPYVLILSTAVWILYSYQEVWLKCLASIAIILAAGNCINSANPGGSTLTQGLVITQTLALSLLLVAIVTAKFAAKGLNFADFRNMEDAPEKHKPWLIPFASTALISGFFFTIAVVTTGMLVIEQAFTTHIYAIPTCVTSVISFLILALTPYLSCLTGQANWPTERANNFQALEFSIRKLVVPFNHASIFPAPLKCFLSGGLRPAILHVFFGSWLVASSACLLFYNLIVIHSDLQPFCFKGLIYLFNTDYLIGIICLGTLAYAILSGDRHSKNGVEWFERKDYLIRISIATGLFTSPLFINKLSVIIAHTAPAFTTN